MSPSLDKAAKTGRGSAFAAVCRRLSGGADALRDRWLYRLPKAEALPIHLTRRRIYVLPTGAGLAWAVVLMVMLIASINYNLSLGYALVFLLFGVGLASVFHGFRNLNHLTIERISASPVFAGEPVVFQVSLRHATAQPRHALRLKTRATLSDEFSTDAQGQQQVSVLLPSHARGWLTPGRLSIETRYPLGLARVWSVTVPNASCLIYPTPEDNPPTLPGGNAQPGGRLSVSEGDDDFAGLRQHRDADPPRHVAWKVLARQDTMMTKQFSAAETGESRLDWRTLPDLNTEQRLSRLTAWALDAHRLGLRFSLYLPGRNIAVASGDAHLRACLQALACHDLPTDGGQA